MPEVESSPAQRQSMSENTLPIVGTTCPQACTKAEPSTNIRGRWVTALWTLFIVSLGFLSVGIASRAAILYTAATLVLFMLPGFLVMPAFFGSDPGVRPVRAIIGAVFGIAISSYMAIVIGFLYGWSPKVISLAIVGLSCVCAAVGRIFRGRLHLPVRKWTGIDGSILAGIGIVLVLFSANPSLHVGKLTSHGYAYTWLYGLDFLGRSDYVIAMTTKLPPDLFWMTGISLRMYLVGYAMPAFAYAASGKAIDLHSVLLLMTLSLSFLMLGCLYIFLRTLFSRTKVLLSGVFLVLFAYSYYWLYDVVKAILMRPGQRMQFYDSVSHLFQRTFLVEPQAALATSLLLIVLSILALIRYRLNNFALAAFLGVCLGVSFGTDAMQGVVMIAWFGLFYLGRLVLAKGFLRDEYGPFVAAVVSCGAVCMSFLLLGMYQRSTSHLVKLQFNTWIAEFGLAFFPIEFGPLLFLGVWGAVRWWRGSRDDFGWPLLLLGAVAMMQVLLLEQFPNPRTRMADRLLPIVLVAFAAYLVREWSPGTKRSTRLLAAGIVLAAIPTFFTDIYFTSNVNDIYNTRYVSVEDKQACDWIRQNLPERAVIQGEHNYFAGGPDRGLYLSLISSFAQRPQVLGWFSGAAVLVDNGWNTARQRRADIGEMLSANQLAPLVRIVRKYAIDYVYVGPFEQERHKQLLPLLQSAPDQFREVYSQNGVDIFRYVGADKNRSAEFSGILSLQEIQK